MLPSLVSVVVTVGRLLGVLHVEPAFVRVELLEQQQQRGRLARLDLLLARLDAFEGIERRLLGAFRGKADDVSRRRSRRDQHPPHLTRAGISFPRLDLAHGQARARPAALSRAHGRGRDQGGSEAGAEDGGALARVDAGRG